MNSNPMETIVTRAGQITLSKDIRDALGITIGTPLEVNRVGSTILIEKKDAKYWDKAGKILPEDFESTLRLLRRGADVRLREQGML